MRRGQVLAIVQAGGKGSRMDVLTRERAKPALPFGGAHRLIDVAMSSLYHAEITDVWVSVQYQISSMDTYLAGGRPWDLDRNRGGFRRMVPQTGTGTPTEDGFSHGNADLLLRLGADIEAAAPEHVLVMSADHIFNDDLHRVIEGHIASGMTATLLTTEVTKKEASDNVVVLTNAQGRVTGLEVKAARPSSNTVATEIFIYRTEPLLKALGTLRNRLAESRTPGEDESADSGLGDFGEHLLPHLIETGSVNAVPLNGYWRDLGQPSLYLQAHRDLLAGKVDLYEHPDRRIIGPPLDHPAARVAPGAIVSNSILSPGCVVAGEVHDSVLGPGTVVKAGAVVRDSVLFEDVVVAGGARIAHTIVDDGSRIGPKAVVGAETASRVVKDDELVLIGQESQVNGTVEPGGRLEPGSSV